MTRNEVSKQIDKLTKQKQDELNEIALRISEAGDRIRTAEEEIKAATAEMDVDRYEAATATKRKAEIALRMYRERQRQIQERVFVTEEESDKVISGLLDYEQQLADKFQAQAAPLLDQLRQAVESYQAEVRETEGVLSVWTNNIHQNYRAEGTGPRREKPVPVHPGGYNGSAYFMRVRSVLEQLERWGVYDK